jgi:hypothetical protein
MAVSAAICHAASNAAEIWSAMLSPERALYRECPRNASLARDTFPVYARHLS